MSANKQFIGDIPGRTAALSTCRLSRTRVRPFLTVFVLALLASCASNPEQIALMPAPAVYEGGLVNPFVPPRVLEAGPQTGVFYASDRAPADGNDKQRFYKNERGHLLRIGVAEVELGLQGTTWKKPNGSRHSRSGARPAIAHTSRT